MKSFPATKLDNIRNVGRYEFMGADIDVIEGALPMVEAMQKLVEEISAPLDRLTFAEFVLLIRAIRDGWESETPVVTASSVPDVTSPFD